jgi:hypothetical protein
MLKTPDFHIFSLNLFQQSISFLHRLLKPRVSPIKLLEPLLKLNSQRHHLLLLLSPNPGNLRPEPIVNLAKFIAPFLEIMMGFLFSCELLVQALGRDAFVLGLEGGVRGSTVAAVQEVVEGVLLFGLAADGAEQLVVMPHDYQKL